MGAQGRRRLSGAGRGAPVSLTEDPTEALSIPHTSQSAAGMGHPPPAAGEHKPVLKETL